MVNKDATNKFQSLCGFWSDGSLELSRLKEGTWDEVKEVVKVDEHEGRTRITIPGRLHGRNLQNKLFMVSDVRMEIIAVAPEQHEMWVDKIRARIAPWDLLLKKMKGGYRVLELEFALGGSANSAVGTKPSSKSTGKVDEKRRDKLVKLPEKLQRLSIVDELIANGTAAVETGATMTKLVASIERVAETAEFIADVSKCTAGVSTVFQLVSLSAQGLSMCMEANRGQRVLPAALRQITILLRYVLESLTRIVKSSQNVNETAIDFVFEALKETESIMDLAETQLLRGRISQIVNAEDVKKVERKIEELKQMAVTADNTSKICALDEKVKRIEEGLEIRDVGPHHVRPSVSAFFSGRKKELATLKDILEKRGSAVITQYGGIGKTELMISFADRAERDKQVSGGVFWVTVDGSVRDVVDSLAGLAEKLTRRRMSEDERRNLNWVIAALKQGLSERKGRWLLCLDNADDNQVRGVLNEVCGIAEPPRRNGWVIVTSRQGQPHIWERMKSEQKLALEPLCTEDAMIALWRQIQKIESSEADDDEVMKEIGELEGSNLAEHRALKKLCGDDSGHGLGGLPLALVQAGSFIAQFKYSYAEYLNLFESANKDRKDIMNKAEELKSIRESQKSIWTTWKISVQKISEEAYTVLRAMALLGQGGIGEAILNGILKASTADGGGSVEGIFRKVIVKELIHGSSLIRCKEGRRGNMYTMHRLVRLFILNDMGRGSAAWNDVYSLALHAVHQVVETELRKEGNSFEQMPDVFENNHREFGDHCLALVHHHVLPSTGSEIRDASEVEDIHHYSGMEKRFMGKSEQEVQVWEHLLAALQHQQAEKRSKSSIDGLSDALHHENQEKEVKIRIAAAHDKLGSALMTTGKLSRAAEELEHSLELSRVIHGYERPHANIASTLDNLGNVYDLMGKLHKALEKHEQSLEMRRAIHGNEKPHPDIASSLHNLALVYEAMGKLDNALEKHEQSLKIYRAIHGRGKPHPDIASSLNSIGSVYEKMGELEKALEKHGHSLDMTRLIHGHERPHPDIASSLNNLGNVYYRMCRLEKAVEMHEQSLAMSRAIHGHGKPHSDIATSLNNIGLVYEAMGKLDEALEKHEQSLEMRQAIHGQGEPRDDIASSLNNIGVVYQGMDKLDKALEKHEQSLEIILAIHGRDRPHPAIVSSLGNLGLVYQAMGKLDDALEKHEQSLQMSLAIHGHRKPHPDIASCLNNLGNVYYRMGKLDKALEKHEQSLKMERAIHGPSKPHSHIASSLQNLGNVYSGMGNLDKALEKHKQCLEMRHAIHGHGKPHTDTALSLRVIGLVYRRQKKLNHAADFLEQSFEMLRVVHGRNLLHAHITAVESDLADLYEDQGKRYEPCKKKRRVQAQIDS